MCHVTWFRNTGCTRPCPGGAWNQQAPSLGSLRKPQKTTKLLELVSMYFILFFFTKIPCQTIVLMTRKGGWMDMAWRAENSPSKCHHLKPGAHERTGRQLRKRLPLPHSGPVALCAGPGWKCAHRAWPVVRSAAQNGRSRAPWEALARDSPHGEEQAATWRVRISWAPGVTFNSQGSPRGSSELFHVPGESQVVWVTSGFPR